MPTVILLDVSLSMCRNLILKDGNENDCVRDVAIRGITSFLDQISANSKMEFTSLMVFSSLWERVVPFTRDYEQLKTALAAFDSLFDKTNIINAINGVNEVVMEEWGSSCPLVNIVLVTDGCLGLIGNDIPSPKKPFLFPCKLHVVLLMTKTEKTVQTSVSFFEKLIASYGLDGSLPGSSQAKTYDIQVHALDNLSQAAVNNIFTTIVDSQYTPWKGSLFCGNLFSPVTLYPSLEPFTQIGDFQALSGRPSGELKIIGFMTIDEVASPPVLSRHLVFAAPMTREQLLTQPSVLNLTDTSSTSGLIESDLDVMMSEDGKQPSLCVLLHGALKVEGMVAVTEIGPDWFGLLYSWADSKKKSNLMLSAFYPSSDSVPWLGKLRNLGNPLNTPKVADHEIDKMKGKKSYHSQNTVVWIRPSGLQSDIQKIVRLAKRLPEKTNNFYKELSRFRRAAASFGFYEILEGLATILDRELTLLHSAGQVNPDIIMHLQYAATVLRSREAYDAEIPPFTR